MKKRVLLFFPDNPHVPRSGAHRRCLSMLYGLKSLGYEIFFVSSTLYSGSSWSAKDTGSFKNHLGDALGDVLVFRANIFQHLFVKSFRAYWKITGKVFCKQLYAPPFLKSWFRQIIKNIDPSVVFMNYAYWDPLIDHNYLDFHKKIKVIDTHDILSLNRQYYRAMRGIFGRDSDKSRYHESIVSDEFLNKLQFKADPDEFAIYDLYTHCISISKSEDDLIRNNTTKTNVAYIPITCKPVYNNNSYLASPVFAMGPNIFNYHGYLYFSRRVAPIIVRDVDHFSVDITGSGRIYDKCKRENWARFLGFVPSLSSVYRHAAFALCPVVVGTGQQVKIVEAMAHGLGVVCHPAAAKDSLVRHGVNGLIAQTAEEFAEYVKQLFLDRALCRRLGSAARQTVEAEASDASLTGWLSRFLPS
ncbi:MAG: glycosyltransferase [Syntrophobacteraceae bacterium]|nr:glycosyltransferase [Syntrophobacteraceae bacterium]